MTKPPRLFIWISIVLIVVLLSACQDPQVKEGELAQTYAAQTLTAMPSDTATPIEPATPTPTPTITLTATPLPTVGPVGPVDFPEDVNPLTGLKVEDPAILDRRPVFVKVANYPASGRPHAGLSFADLVFEYYIGYGGNRFIALFYGQDAAKVGPVRSGRLVDPQLVSLYEGILGFQGAYVTIYNEIKDVLGDRAISGTGNVCPAICDDGRNIVTSVFADSKALTDLAEERGVSNERYTLEGMAFDPIPPEDGESGDRAMILYSSLNRGEWRYDEETGFYRRWIEDLSGEDLEMIPLVDSETKSQLTFSNVVVIFAYNNELAPSMHDIDIWGNTTGQRAVLFRDGFAYEITWAAPSKTQPIRFFDEAGEAVPLKPGNTWIVIMGNNSQVDQDEGNWTFTFYLP